MDRDDPLWRAFTRLNERKKAIYGAAEGLATAQGDELRALALGVDLDVLGAEKIGRAVAMLTVGQLDAIAESHGGRMHGEYVAAVLSGQWIEGVVCGLMLAQIHADDEKRKAAADAS